MYSPTAQSTTGQEIPGTDGEVKGFQGDLEGVLEKLASSYSMGERMNSRFSVLAYTSLSNGYIHNFAYSLDSIDFNTD